MTIKKIPAEVNEALQQSGIAELSDFGLELLRNAKAGHHIFATAPKNSGKSIAAIVACLNKVNKPTEGAPRVLYVCDSIERSIHVHELLSKVTEPLDLTVDLVHDKGDMVKQRNDIFNGTEIIVGTVKRIFDLYVQNGINVQLLEFLVFDGFENQLSQGRVMEIKRLMEGVQKTRIICLSDENSTRVQQFLDSTSISFKELN